MQEMNYPEASGLAAGLGIGMIVLYLVLYLFFGFCLYKIFEKAGKPGWAGFVPIYNLIVVLEISGKPVWWIILLFIPCVNIVILFIVWIEFAKAFGQGAGFGIGLTLLSIIFLPILAFGNYQYVGAGGQTPTPPAS